MKPGYLALVLHAHLPFVREIEDDDSLQQHWLFEAITETYIPLLLVFDNLIRDRIDFRLTFSITPTLAWKSTGKVLDECLPVSGSRSAVTAPAWTRCSMRWEFDLRSWKHTGLHVRTNGPATAFMRRCIAHPGSPRSGVIRILPGRYGVR